MFQYAAGRARSLEMCVPFRLDISCFTKYELHQGFEIQRIFSCASDIASKDDLRRVMGWQSSSVIRRFLLRSDMALFRRKEFVVEPNLHYWPQIIKVPSDCYLVGYWQSEKYFLEVADQIRKDFSFRLPIKNQNVKLAKHIKQVNAVSLHIRRGDYANNPKTEAIHGLCSLDYYRQSIRYIGERVQQPHFFVFSDDIAWVKSNLKIEFTHQYVDHNHGAESYNDMRLMSLCQNHIIANSTFSWWGAWLNPYIDKIVIAPKRWFANETNTQDLIPQSWVRL